MVQMAQTQSMNVFVLLQFNNMSTHFGLDASQELFDGNQEKLHNLNASGMQWIIGQARQQDNTVKQLFVLAQLCGVGAVLPKVCQ